MIMTVPVIGIFLPVYITARNQRDREDVDGASGAAGSLTAYCSIYDTPDEVMYYNFVVNAKTNLSATDQTYLKQETKKYLDDLKQNCTVSVTLASGNA